MISSRLCGPAVPTCFGTRCIHSTAIKELGLWARSVISKEKKDRVTWEKGLGDAASTPSTFCAVTGQAHVKNLSFPFIQLCTECLYVIIIIKIAPWLFLCLVMGLDIFEIFQQATI